MIWYSAFEDEDLSTLEPGARFLALYAAKRADQLGLSGDTGLTPRGLCVAARVDPRAGLRWVSLLKICGVMTPSKDATLISVSPSFLSTVLRRRGGVDGAQWGRGVEGKRVRGIIKETPGPSLPSEAQVVTTQNRKRIDVTRAKVFGERFCKWYLAGYGRPHSSPTWKDLCSLSALLRKVDREKLAVAAAATLESEDVVMSAADQAARDKTVWFLRGNPLDLKCLTRNWPQVWDWWLCQAQEWGQMPKGALEYV